MVNKIFQTYLIHSNQLKYLYLVATSREVNEFKHSSISIWVLPIIKRVISITRCKQDFGSDLCSKDKYQEYAVKNVNLGGTKANISTAENANSMNPQEIKKKGCNHQKIDEPGTDINI